MLKRLFTVFFAAAIVMSACVTALAEPIDAEKNIYKTWGDFENEELWDAVIANKITYGSTVTCSIADEGARGTNHSLKIEKSATSAVFQIYTYGVYGETYDVSFYVKTDTPGITKLSLISIYDNSGAVQEKIIPLTMEKGWVKYFTTIAIPETAEGRKVKGSGTFRLSFGGKAPNGFTAYIDELCVVPKGYVPDADYSRADVGLYGVDTDDGIEVASPAKTFDTDFQDTQNHWAEETIASLAKYGYVSGFSASEFQPEGVLTRAQFSTLVSNLYEETCSYNGEFSDITGDEWFADTAAFAKQKGFLADEMCPNEMFMPDMSITREEVAYIASKAALDKGAKKGESLEFSDESDMSDWAKSAVFEAATLGLIEGYEDGSFRPKENITRAEAAVIIMRLLETYSKMNIYVDAKSGNDSYDGTKEFPLKTIFAARDMAKAYAHDMQNDIYIRIKGEQYLEETFALDESYSGQNGYRIVYTSWGEEKAKITMAKTFGDFRLHDAEKNIWKAYVGEGTFSRQAYFNDVPGIRSRTLGYLKNAEFVYNTHYLCDDFDLLYIEHPQDLDFVFHSLWCHYVYKAEKIYQEGDKVRIDMNDYYTSSDRLTYYDGSQNTVRQRPSYIENAYDFLDESGEWYLDKYDGFMYYIPRAGEDMDTLTCKIPMGEELIHVSGSTYNTPVSHIAFENLLLEGATWHRNEEVGGSAFIQANVLYDKHTKTSTPEFDKWPLYFAACRYIDITNCDIKHFGNPGAALMFYEGAKHVNLIGNEFYQLSGSALAIDRSEYSRPSERAANSICENFFVKNNYIHDIGIHWPGAAGVTFGHPRHTVFTHNELSNMPYSGMHIGWGWGQMAKTGSVMYDVEISNNYIHDVMKERVSDGSCIYTLGASSLECDEKNIEENNKIIGNYLANGWQCDYVYPDEGSTSWYIADNVADRGPVQEIEYNFDRAETSVGFQYWTKLHADTIKWITYGQNYATDDYAYLVGYMRGTDCDYGPLDIVKNNHWPDEAKNIMAKAGIEDAYKENFDLSGAKIFASNNRRQTVDLETPTDSGLMILGDYNTEYPLSDYKIHWWVEDPEAVTLDKNGMITAHKKGIFEAEAFALVNGVWQSQHFLLECGDEVISMSLNQENLNMIEGFSTEIVVNAKTSFGINKEVTKDADVNIKSEDTNVAQIEPIADGSVLVVRAVGRGETAITGTISYGGVIYEVHVPVKVITYGSEEGATLPFTPVNFQTGWKDTGMKQEDGGVMISGSPTHTNARYDGLVGFDLKVNPGSNWPTIAFADSDRMGNYNSNDCYMIGFKEDHIELQRWNLGKRTMIFGNDVRSFGGPGIPNEGEEKMYEYGERISVVMGAIKVDGGTRIVLNINGKNVIDYMDIGDQAISSEGYFVVYNPLPGGMVFYPYSGITKD